MTTIMPPTPCAIFDIDGTLADTSHRIHYLDERPKKWREFNAACHLDPPIEATIELARIVGAEVHLLLFTGRLESQREATLEWLRKHRIDFAGLHMRRDGDYRQDDVIKSEMCDTAIRAGFKPLFVFEDRPRVVSMWRRRGIVCFACDDTSWSSRGAE